MAARHRTLLLLCATLAVACRTTTTSSPPNLSSAVVVRSLPHEAWQVVEGDRTVGWVVRYAGENVETRAFFSVRNEHQQVLGVVDLDGRAWRYRAHQREPDWLGTGTIAGGARAILGASQQAQLVPIGLERLVEPAPAAMPR
jgi:hypothetical protein